MYRRAIVLVDGEYRGRYPVVDMEQIEMQVPAFRRSGRMIFSIFTKGFIARNGDGTCYKYQEEWRNRLLAQDAEQGAGARAE